MRSYIQPLKKEVSFFLDPYPFKRHQLKNKYLFIHIPKNAGTALCRALGDNEIHRVHLPYFVYRNAYMKAFNNYFKFSIVRNPWDRVVSIYSYLKAGGNQTIDKHFETMFKEQNITFEKFIFEFLDNQSMHSHSMFRPQFPFIYDEQETLMVDYVGRQENMNEALEEISNHIPIKASPLRSINASKRNDYRTYYTCNNLIDAVEKLYLKDVKLFKYTFE